jgi:hypothetical protein
MDFKINARIGKAIKIFASLVLLNLSCKITKSKEKSRLLTTTMLEPLALYESETWVMSAKHDRRLN